ncbi:MAG: protein TolQ [Zoogloeaceae bacterium]|jgi:biopolymer transport protein TolQ|nr:protein TolQ [Zoogloeaceae bacterium]
MNFTQDLSILDLFLNASGVVQAIMALLLLVSLISWFHIISKWFAVRASQKKTEHFEREFWQGGDMKRLYDFAAANHHQAGSMERVFEAGFQEFKRIKALKDFEPSDVIDAARRAMRATHQREQDALEAHLSFLASVGSVSPYIGLFGTVWGIMHAFRALGNVGQATLSTVAPGIAEALVATAIGLFAAIPAVLAYNRFSHDIDRLAIRHESFMEEFSNILQRQMR